MERLEHIKQSFKSVWGKVKAVLYRYQWRQVLIFLFFVLLSFGFWILQSLQEEYEIRISVPIRYRNMPVGIAFADDPPSEITARLRDKGSVLLNYSIGQKLSSIDIDMKGIRSHDGTLVFSEKDIESAIMKQLIATTNLVSFIPQRINEPYSALVNRKIPVAFDGDIRTNAGYALSGEIGIDPPVVDAYATEGVLDTIHFIRTVHTEINKGNKRIQRKVQLQKIGGVTIEPNTVYVTIPIEEYTEKTLEVHVRSRNVPRDYTIRMFPSTVKLSCAVPLSRFKELTEDQFEVEILVDLEQSVSGSLTVQLTKKPDWVDQVNISPKSVEFILEPNHAE